MLLNCSFLFFIYLKLKLSEQFVVSNDEGKIIFLKFNDLIIIVSLNCLFLVFIHIMLELGEQFAVLNNDKKLYLLNIDTTQI